jgi:hypothetical protein
MNNSKSVMTSRNPTEAAEAEVETEAEACIGGGDSRCGRSEAEVEAAETVEVEAVEMEAVEAKVAKVAKAAEAEGCIGGGGMYWKHWNALEVHGGRQS